MRTAQDQLAQTIGSLVIENAQLREELDRVTEKLATEVARNGESASSDSREGG